MNSPEEAVVWGRPVMLRIRGRAEYPRGYQTPRSFRGFFEGYTTVDCLPPITTQLLRVLWRLYHSWLLSTNHKPGKAWMCNPCSIPLCKTFVLQSSMTRTHTFRGVFILVEGSQLYDGPSVKEKIFRYFFSPPYFGGENIFKYIFTTIFCWEKIYWNIFSPPNIRWWKNI